MIEPRAVARNTDPETSWEAAMSVQGIRENQARIWSILMRSGSMTDQRIYREFTFNEYSISTSGCRTRRKELVDLGLVENSGKQALLPSGRHSILWRAVPLDRWRREQFGRADQIRMWA